jgi:hypothetical protein
MGREAECVALAGNERAAGKALLETDELIFRSSSLRLKVPLRSIQRAVARDGNVIIDHEGGRLMLEIGAAAEKWVDAITNPPTLLDKLGIRSDTRVCVRNIDDADFRATITPNPSVSFADEALEAADVILIGAEQRDDLQRVGDAAKRMRSAAALWVVAPKGVKHITEADVLSAGRAAGLKDVKVARFSATHTAHKFVLPKAAR